MQKQREKWRGGEEEERGLTIAAMMEDKYPNKIHNKSSNRYDHQSIVLHLWGLKSPLRNRQDRLSDVRLTMGALLSPQ